MRTNTAAILLAAVSLCALAGGCWPERSAESDPSEELAPLHVRGTVGEYAVLRSGGRVSLQGYGLVAGLGDDGSAEVPPRVRKYFVDVLLKEKLGSYRAGTEGVPPSRLIDDTDTAAVLIGGAMPPGAPEGTRFDVYVSALRQTGTRSLVGGVLLPADLRIAAGNLAAPAGPTKTWASARGSVFVNPFLDPTDRSMEAKLREGRIIGGGVIVRPQPVRLELRRPDYARAQLIERRINERFPTDEKVARARSRSVIEISVPGPMRHDYERFLRLLLHLPLRAGTRDLGRTRELIDALERPDSNHDGIALVLEAIGRQAVPELQRLYASSNPDAAFYAARTGLRLGDTEALDVLVELARASDSAYQVPAIEELGRRGRAVRALSLLRGLIDDENDAVRIAAYEALRQIGDRRSVVTEHIGEEFTLDVVRSSRRPMIYVTQTGTPKIVVFADELPVRKEVFFGTPDGGLTITNGGKYVRLTSKALTAGDVPAYLAMMEWGDADRADEIVLANPDVHWSGLELGDRILIPPAERMLVWRRLAAYGRVSDVFYLDFDAVELIRTIGSPAQPGPDGEIQGLGMTYGEVVGVVYRMCERGDIPAKFVLQQLPEADRIGQAQAMEDAAP